MLEQLLLGVRVASAAIRAVVTQTRGGGNHVQLRVSGSRERRGPHAIPLMTPVLVLVLLLARALGPTRPAAE
jgi:hypothetical protein